MSPEGYFDDRLDYDPPPRRSPRLVADMSRLAGARAVAEVRQSPGPSLTARQRKIKRKHLIMLLARVNNMPLSFIADAFGVSPTQVLRVCRKMGYGEE